MAHRSETKISNLTPVEKREFEQLLGIDPRYVLNFSNRSFAEFVHDSTGHNIFDERYNPASGSKAKRLRTFWRKEDNAVVGKLMGDLLDYSEANGPLAEVCRLVVARLLKDGKFDLSGVSVLEFCIVPDISRGSVRLAQEPAPVLTRCELGSSTNHGLEAQMTTDDLSADGFAALYPQPSPFLRATI
jgi:hypothetical protein